jgi:DNA-binding response OmpR family regulator
MHNVGRVLSRSQILGHVWASDYFGGSNVVDVFIRYLRRKLDEGHTHKLIHTVAGVGYVLRPPDCEGKREEL